MISDALSTLVHWELEDKIHVAHTQSHLILFIDASDYLEHFNDALDEKYRCKICKKEFKDKSNCRRHIKNIHFNDEPVSCPICGRQYKNRNSFASHKDKCVQLPDSDVNSEFTYE